jgi:hypothetical protein
MDGVGSLLPRASVRTKVNFYNLRHIKILRKIYTPQLNHDSKWL